MGNSIKVNRLWESFDHLCWEWIRVHRGNFAQLAREVGIAGPRVSELLGRTRDLSMYYIEQFILGGIFKVADIYDNKPESKEEEAVWDRLKIIENTKLVEALAKAIVRGSLKEESLYSFLQSHFPNQGK